VNRTLEIQPLLRQPALLAARLETNLPVRVVLVDQVLDDGAGFPEREVGVGVVDRGHAAVGVDGEEVGLLDVGELHVFEVVGEAEFFGEHADFGRVGAVFAVDGDGFGGGRHLGGLVVVSGVGVGVGLCVGGMVGWSMLCVVYIHIYTLRCYACGKKLVWIRRAPVDWGHVTTYSAMTLRRSFTRPSSV
jgi:hypothetical protein